MASTMIHLLLAHEINPGGCGLYFMGNFAPDNFDKKRGDFKQAKNKNHFRDAPDMEAELVSLYSRIDRDNPFHVGYFTHLLMDMWWHEMLDRTADDSGDRQGWYSRINAEYRAAGIWIRKNEPWVAEVFGKIASCPDDFISPAPDPSNAEIIAYKHTLLSSLKRDLADNSEAAPSEYFSPEFLESYSKETAKRYGVWVVGQV
jgi:hypothetical protein